MTGNRLSNRAVIQVTGENAADFLQGLLTNDMAHLSADRAHLACLLTPQGKILFDGLVIKVASDILIDVWRDGAAAFAKRLSMYKLRAKIDIKVRDDLAVGLARSEARPDEPNDGVVAAYTDPRHAALARRVIAPPAFFDGDAPDDRHSRISAGVPEWGEDFASDTYFLLDVNYDYLDGVSYKKGCFVGQEVTSRMKRKGTARRRTAIVALEEQSRTALRGMEIMAGETVIGEMLSGALDGKALACIRLDRLEKAISSGTQLNCDGTRLVLSLPAYIGEE